MYSTMIFGCGNLIMGDDGFGPAVIQKLTSEYDLPEWVDAVDAMTGIREYLFDYLLSEEGRPEHIIILDAVDFEDRQPGEVFRISSSDIPARKIHDFSLHQFPTVNLLQEIEEYTGIRVTIVAAQAEYIPEEIEEGLSAPMHAAVSEACELISQILSENSQKEVTCDDVRI
ncbi:MAG: coenzyme F420 hydrogenase [Proteobacteria bacterium]|nr:MAG: coenzyme F420 hydrogenase [Pseudomonadota bacterium]